MKEQKVTIGGAALVARGTGALWWPERRLLCVSDLHLGKSERLARRGRALLPPYETAETLGRLAREIEALAPETMVCLGDSFDDMASARAVRQAEGALLAGLMAGREWIWVGGNHDPAPVKLGGRSAAEFKAGAVVFRHEARAGAVPAEISGHFHPKIRLRARGSSVVRRCFLTDGNRLILPAFGAYTGGLWWNDPAVCGLLSAGASAILTGDPCLAVPLAAVRTRQAG
jgi:uncharacterized protein